MNISNPTTRFVSIFLGIVLSLGLALQIGQLSADSKVDETPAADAPYYFSLEEVADLPGMQEVMAEAPEGIRIKIVIIIIIRKKGIAEIRDIQVARSSRLSSNQILAEAEVRNGRLYVKPVEDNLEGQEVKFLMVQDQLRIRPAVSRELGIVDSIISIRGRMEYEAGKLGNFEIQD